MHASLDFQAANRVRCVDFPVSMLQAPSDAWILRFPCGRQSRMHRLSDFYAAEAVRCLDFPRSMQQTPSDAWISRFPRSRYCLMLGFSAFHAADGAHAVIFRIPCIKRCSMHGSGRKGKNMPIFNEIRHFSCGLLGNSAKPTGAILFSKCARRGSESEA